MRKTIELGKIDYNNVGRRNHLATIEFSFDGSRFSASANIWNTRNTDIVCGGQCLEEVCAYFPNNDHAQRLLAIWREWHLNDVKAGSPAQEAFLKANPVTYAHPVSHYDAACAALEAAGLLVDENCIHNGKPYRYGSAWLKTEVPADVVAEIESLAA